MKLKDWTTEELVDYSVVLEKRIRKIRSGKKWWHSRLTKDAYDCTEQYLMDMYWKTYKILKERNYNS